MEKSMSKHKLIIDTRKISDSGIGTYIKNVIPRVLNIISNDFDIRLLTLSNNSEEALPLEKYKDICIPVSQQTFSIEEQLMFHNKLKGGSTFWATSLSHPLFTRQPIISTVHDVIQIIRTPTIKEKIIRKIIFNLYLKSIREKSKLIIFNSHFTKSEFLSHVGHPKERNIVTHLGVAPEWNNENQLKNRINHEKYFICISNLKPHKNLKNLISGFNNIKNQIPHNLILVVNNRNIQCKYAATVMNMIENNSRIIILQNLTTEELCNLVFYADAMIFPSFYEGFGLPAVEAMSVGCPVISSNCGALKEVCSDAAIYLDPSSINDISGKILFYLSLSKEEKNEMIKKGHILAKYYDWQKTADLTATEIYNFFK